MNLAVEDQGVQELVDAMVLSGCRMSSNLTNND
jgi:hypothetical protein